MNYLHLAHLPTFSCGLTHFIFDSNIEVNGDDNEVLILNDRSGKENHFEIADEDGFLYKG